MYPHLHGEEPTNPQKGRASGQRFYSLLALTLSDERRVTFVVLARVESSFGDGDGDDNGAAPAIN